MRQSNRSATPQTLAPRAGGNAPAARAAFWEACPTAAIAIDRDLLFGLLALQNGLIDQGQLLAVFQAWTRDRFRPLADHLAARCDLDAGERAGIEAMVGLHLKKHGGSAERRPSIASTP
jgi:hypothetical protein